MSNALLSGIVPELRRRFTGPVCCLLQGDDIFIEQLREPWKSKAIRLISSRDSEFDAFLTHSQYYSSFMQDYLKLSPSRFRQIPLAIDDSPALASDVASEVPGKRLITVGYFARICPEKGAFRFLEAAARVLPQRSDLRFVIGGYLARQHEQRFQTELRQLQSRFGARIHWAGSPDTREEKFDVLRAFDWLCVPTEYREPKGLYVLEAALVGVPSLLPNHGAFPERIAALQSGTLYPPHESDSLDGELLRLQRPDPEIRRDLRERCLRQFAMEHVGTEVLRQLQQVSDSVTRSGRPHNHP